jgi:hypothetical protein
MGGIPSARASVAHPRNRTRTLKSAASTLSRWIGSSSTARSGFGALGFRQTFRSRRTAMGDSIPVETPALREDFKTGPYLDLR